jgi:hypothetical protein
MLRAHSDEQAFREYKSGIPVQRPRKRRTFGVYSVNRRKSGQSEPLRGANTDSRAHALSFALSFGCSDQFTTRALVRRRSGVISSVAATQSRLLRPRPPTSLRGSIIRQIRQLCAIRGRSSSFTSAARRPWARECARRASSCQSSSGHGRGPPESGPLERLTIYGQIRAFGHTGVASDRPSGTGSVAATV